MIVNQRIEESIVRKLEESKFVFYLTGSRFFGGAIPTSDWDYFTEDTPEVREFLSSLGFFTVDDQMLSYDDRTITSIWQKNDIHMQLVHDVQWKVLAQNYLSKFGNLKSVPKATRKHLWNMALEATKAEVIELHRQFMEESLGLKKF